MTNEEIQEIVAKADAEYDRLKDRVHEQYDEIKRLNNIIKEYEVRFKMIKKIVQDNILEELDDISYACMMSTIDSVCDGKPGFLAMLNNEKE